jgi:hypothetical protein
VSWAFLDAVPSTLDLPTVPIRLRRAVLFGVAGGVIAVLAGHWLRLALPITSLHELGWPETSAAARGAALLLLGAAAQGLVAVLVTLAIPRLAIPHAMCAAFVSGSVFAMTEVLRASLHGQDSFAALATVVVPVVMFGGALLAIVGASVAFLLADSVPWLLARSAAWTRSSSRRSAEPAR